MKFVKVRFHLAALTRVIYDFEKEIEIEEGQKLNEAKLIKLANEAYDATHPAKFEFDPDFWEKGACYAELVPEDEDVLEE